MRYHTLLKGITSLPDNESPAVWKYINDQDAEIKSEFEEIYNMRLNDDQQAKFVYALQRVNSPDITIEERHEHFMLLAKDYDCIFLWLEEGNQGTMP